METGSDSNNSNNNDGSRLREIFIRQGGLRRDYRLCSSRKSIRKVSITVDKKELKNTFRGLKYLTRAIRNQFVRITVRTILFKRAKSVNFLTMESSCLWR